MSRLITIDHRVAPVRLEAARAPEGSLLGWSARRRLAFLTGCIVLTWSVVLTPVILLF